MVTLVLRVSVLAVLVIVGAQARGTSLIMPGSSQYPASVPGNYSKIHTIAVISAIGEEMTLHSAGLVARARKTNISNWKIDDSITASIQQNLRGRFQIKAVSYDRVKLAAIPNGPWDVRSSALRTFLASVRGDDVDAFIVVRPDIERNAPGFPGIAFQNGTALDSSALWLWTNYEIDVVDARSLSIIGWAYSRLDRWPGYQPGFAGKYVADSSLKLDNDTLDPTDEQLAKLRLLVSSLVSDSVSATLRVLGLVSVEALDSGMDKLLENGPN